MERPLLYLTAMSMAHLVWVWDASTKDCIHQRRASVCGPTVVFDPDMIITLRKEEFLSNKANKQRFINLLADRLKQEGCSILHAKGDADLLIVKETIKESNTAVLVGDDTDLFVLVCYHGEMNANDLYFKPEPKQRAKTRIVWNIKKTKSALGLDVCSKPQTFCLCMRFLVAPLAHEALLEIIRCNCKTNCSSQRCTCKKHGLDCSVTCGVCKGQGCVNSVRPDLDEYPDPWW